MNDLPAMKREISGLKDEIRKLGNVNVNAIEDYKNLMERYTFMKTQHDDLVEAEKTLEGIIEELDTAMRKQFTEKFAEISREFDKVFKELFGGGKGTLELMEDEDILEAGVRIIAQPPGRKKASEHDAALRWREVVIRHFPTVRNSEPEAVSVLPVRRDRGRTG